MASSTNDFLSEEVWPFLDAVDAGFFSDLNPGSKSQNNSYKMDCPKCGEKRRAFYFTAGLLICDRIENCGYRQAPFAYLVEYKKYSRKEALEACANAVGKELPKDGSYKKTADSVFKALTQKALFGNPELMEIVAKSRSLTIDELKSYEVGFFPNLDVLYEGFKQNKISYDEAREKGYLPYPKNSDVKNNAYFMQNRLIGYWAQPDGSLGFWGRIIDGIESPGQRDNQKYIFNSGIKKSIPYLLRGSLSQWHVAIEGPFDVFALNQLGLNSFGIGGASIIKSQAATLKERGINRVIHLTDGDFPALAGAVDSIVNCSEIGIECYVAPLGEYLDDPDDLRRKGKDLVSIEVINSAFRPGAFLAHARNHIYRRYTAPHHLRVIDAIDKLLPILPGPVAADYKDTNESMGYTIHL